MQVRHIFISPEHIYAGHHGREPGVTGMHEVESVECVAGRGLRGDRYFDHKVDYKGQVTFFSLETHERLKTRLCLESTSVDMYRRNIVVSGADLNALIGQEFEIQGIRFAGTEEARPCYWMNRALGEGAEEALRGAGGLRARILSDGVLTRDV